jgi:hypothetical protein
MVKMDFDPKNEDVERARRGEGMALRGLGVDGVGVDGLGVDERKRDQVENVTRIFHKCSRALAGPLPALETFPQSGV